jgi:DNA excision repair protein ERCC-3
VTVATYQILTHRKGRLDGFTHMDLFDRGGFGLIVYDEVHLLPAPVFRATAGIQARRRLGLTATLVREDGRQGEVFSLIGPKRYELPWKQLERQGFLAPARCAEVRIPLSAARSERYAAATPRAQIRIAADNEQKDDVTGALLRLHSTDRVLIIGQYLEQLQHLAAIFRMPLITGQTPNQERERLYAAFRRGELPQLIVSKVGNFAVDLPVLGCRASAGPLHGDRLRSGRRRALLQVGVCRRHGARPRRDPDLHHAGHVHREGHRDRRRGQDVLEGRPGGRDQPERRAADGGRDVRRLARSGAAEGAVQRGRQRSGRARERPAVHVGLR